MDYQVKLDSFEGPLDLLLHLIKKNEVDITDIPVAIITEQYLEQIEMMKELNLDLAGEFLLMAATLIHIKSKMLLPPSDEEETDEEEGDPREELVRRLLEYKKYKEAALELSEMDQLERDSFVRGFYEELEEDEEEPCSDVSLYDLMKALNEVFATAAKKPKAHEVSLEKVSVREKIDIINSRIEKEGHVSFHSLFDKDTSRSHMVATFLAMLEMIKMKTIKAFQGENFGNITISAKETLH